MAEPGKRDKTMGSNYDEDKIIQNLKDTGCDEDTVTAFLNDIREEKLTDGLKLLSTHRRSLLDELHKTQKRIDCLDYLVYVLKKQA